MQITITHDFDNVEAAAEFLARVGNEASVGVTVVTDAPPKPARKPRADAGQPRAPYKPRTTEANPAGAGAQTSETSGAPAGSAAAPAGAASSVSSAPAEPATAPQAQAGAVSATAPVAGDFPATLEGARKAMAALNATAGKGMDACIQALKFAGVNRISDLPKEKYADFIKAVLADSSAEGIAAAKKAPAAKK